MNPSKLRLLCAMIFWPGSACATPAPLKDARAQIGVTGHDDPACRRPAFPMGDVPADRGVCTGVIVRAYRKIGHGTQEEDILFRYPINGHDRYPAAPKGRS